MAPLIEPCVYTIDILSINIYLYVVLFCFFVK